MPRGRKKKSEMIREDGMIDTSTGPVDAYVGGRIAARRKLIQMSQKQMADQLGVTFQQVQKYEKGVNRIGAGRLYSIACILGVDIDYFYTNMPNGLSVSTPKCSYAESDNYTSVGNGYFLHEDESSYKFDAVQGAEALMLLKAFYSLPAKARSGLLMMLSGLKGDDGNDAKSE